MKVSEFLVFKVPLVDLQQIREWWVVCILFGICCISKKWGEFGCFGAISNGKIKKSTL